MQPSPSSSRMIPTNSNLTTSNSNFWSNGSVRKRKADATDLDEKVNQKMFVTEEKMVKEMQTLSLELAALNGNKSTPTPQIEEENSLDETKSDDEEETCIEIHQLLKNSLKNDDLQDSLISKLCAMERKKLTMQIVPYMPIHPAQLNNTKDEEEIIENPISSDEVKTDNDDILFKIPSVPTPYTVEEPCDSTVKRGSTMKRSYSQADQYNNNLSVTELKSDGTDDLSSHRFQSAYFIVEPTAPSLSQSTSNTSSSSDGPSVRITEFIEDPPVDDDDDIDMQSVASSDTGDKMDDD